jgi:hypothetical protein
VLLAWATPLRPADAAEPAAMASSAVRESFRFDPNEGLILIPVHVGNRDYPFVVDTGTGVNGFDVSLRSSLGPRVDTGQMFTPGNGKTIAFELYSAPNARIGSLVLKKSPVGCIDLTPCREAFGSDIRGILGIDFLEDWIVAIDFDQGRFSVLAPGTPADAKWGESVSVEYDDSRLICVLPTVSAGVRDLFRIDTGSNGAVDLDDALFSRLVSLHEVRVTGDSKAMTLSGSYSPRAGRLSQFSLGSFQHEKLRTTSGKQNSLGLAYLHRYRVTIDFPGKRLFLAKGKHFADPDRGPMLGADLMFRGGAIAVESVDQRGPAYAAGVRAKDVIVELCGKPVSERKSSEIRRLLTTEGKAVQVTVQRGGKRMEMQFTPREYE